MKLLISEKYNKLYISWLITLISLIILMIIVGGLTRLTDSGLSITRWELFLGMFLILGSAWILVNIVEIYTKVEKWLQKDKWF